MLAFAQWKASRILTACRPMAFLTELATNASAHGVSVLLYSGNEDTLIAHRGTESKPALLRRECMHAKHNPAVVIQNTTFGGIQGFTRKPSTPWFDDDGKQAGIVHQERNWTYVLVEGAGHLVAYNSPPRVSRSPIVLVPACR